MPLESLHVQNKSPRPSWAQSAVETGGSLERIYHFKKIIITYDHRLRRIGHPVRSAIHKPQIGKLVVEWVTISESLLSYVFFFFFVAVAKKLLFAGSLIKWCGLVDVSERSGYLFFCYWKSC